MCLLFLFSVVCRCRRFCLSSVIVSYALTTAAEIMIIDFLLLQQLKENERLVRRGRQDRLGRVDWLKLTAQWHHNNKMHEINPYITAHLTERKGSKSRAIEKARKGSCVPIHNTYVQAQLQAWFTRDLVLASSYCQGIVIKWANQMNLIVCNSVLKDNTKIRIIIIEHALFNHGSSIFLAV